MTHIALKNISQVYPGLNGEEKTIIKDLDFSANKTEGKGVFKVILGPSGCGKSTLLRYIAGLQNPTSGEVLVNGEPADARKGVGMVFQKYSSFPWRTVLDNVALGLELKGVGKKERRERAMEMIKLVGLEGNEKKFAQYPSLSGGQLQRVAIARSLLASPEILLMDEPFGALDIKTRLQMQDLLVSIWKNIEPVVILVTHDIAEAVYLADEIYIMSNAPAKIKHHIKVDLPVNRDKSIKRNPKFTSMVHQIEDLMMQLES